MNINLKQVRQEVIGYCESLLDREGPYGCYRSGIGERSDLFSSLDIALIRAIMGEDLSLLPEKRRLEWIGHINSYTDYYFNDGRYKDIYTHHSPLHANGMVIGALGVLGGKQKLPVRLYNEFKDENQVEAWLENINWIHQWTASHLFWGGMHCYSFSHGCTKQWLDLVFDWLDRHVDEKTGWWCKGIPHADRHQSLGGSVHILPIYQHHHRAFPYPTQVIDSVLALQLPTGRWLQTEEINCMNYLELDALYALRYMQQFAPEYRKDDIRTSVVKYAELVVDYYNCFKEQIFTLHPHGVLAMVSTFGLLQQFFSDKFVDDNVWTDIFSNIQFYQTAEVEQF